jgi:hypothetical protein
MKTIKQQVFVEQHLRCGERSGGRSARWLFGEIGPFHWDREPYKT